MSGTQRAGEAKGLATGWRNPLVKIGTVKPLMGETTPLVFNGRLYRLENWQKFMDLPNATVADQFMDDQVRVWDVEADELVSVVCEGHSFGTAFVWQGRVHVYAAKHPAGQPWRTVKQITLTTSDDLRTWSDPEVVIEAGPDEHLFNAAVCRGDGRFVLLLETDDPQWPKFTFKYYASDDLRSWEILPGAVYGREKYVGGPALYYENGWYYTLYLEDLGGSWETRITRSRDLRHWQDAPPDRPFLTFDRDRQLSYYHQGQQHHVREINASDAELCEWQGKTIVYFNGGDQQTAGDLQLAEFEGPAGELFEAFYAEPDLVVPAARQRAFQERQFGAFVHFGMATWYEGPESAVFPRSLREPYAFDMNAWGAMTAQPPASVFDPRELDAAQWADAAAAMGARHVVLTAKHHNGFCLWPTETTEYSVRNSPWRGGRGDVLAEFAAAVRAAGLGVGFYISAGDVNQGCFSTPEPAGQRRQLGDADRYLEVFARQFREILSGYGELCEIWLDGALDPFSSDVRGPDGQAVGSRYWPGLIEMARELQPGAVIMGGTSPDVRWCGNEAGLAPYPLWCEVNPGEEESYFLPPGVTGWVVPEADVFTRPGWFWQPGSDEALMPLERLREIYHRSIGHGANLLVNMTPDRRGLVPDAEVRRLGELGEDIRRRYTGPLAGIGSEGQWGEGATLELSWDAPAEVIAAVMEEDCSQGQRVRRYRLEADVAGEWTPVAEGLSIGRLRIERFDAVRTGRVRLRVLESEPLPKIRRFEVFAG